MTANSPMSSPEHNTENEPNVIPQSRRGRKKMRRDRSKAYRKIAQLEKSIKEKERVIARTEIRELAYYYSHILTSLFVFQSGKGVCGG
jgi:hypothetical protein